MGTVKRLAEAVRQGLEAALPGLRKTLLKKLPLAVGAMLEAQTANTMALAAVLPLASKRLDRRAQWLMRLLSNPRVDSATVMELFAREVLTQAAEHGQVVALSLDQTEVGDRFAVLMVSVRLGERALPLAWRVKAGAANLGFAFQRAVLEQRRASAVNAPPISAYPYVCLSRDPRHQALHGQACRVIDSRTRAAAQRVLVEFPDGTRATVHAAAIRRRTSRVPMRKRNTA